MTVAMVLMESPAIIMAVLLARWVRFRDAAKAQLGGALSMGKIVHTAFTDGAHLLLLGSLAIGLADRLGAAGPVTGHDTQPTRVRWPSRMCGMEACYAAGLASPNKSCLAAWLMATTAGCVSRRSTEMA